MEKCPCCERMSYTVDNRRVNTAYVDDKSNWLNSCLYCYADAEEYYCERWEEYNQGRL